LGGGYPESFPEKLSSNQGLKAEILRKIKSGMPVYAECGGMMYLGKSLTGFNGKSYSMVGAVPARTRMDRNFLAIRYVKVKTARETVLGPKGTEAHGQEFHQSRIAGGGFPGSKPYRVADSVGRKSREGFASDNLLASYIHLHFKSNPSVPAAFLRKCRVYESKVRS
jgi:cobyrinic acid a,c-diamide synthase